MHPQTTIEAHGVPNRPCFLVSACGKYPSSAIAAGNREMLSMIALNNAAALTKPPIASQVPSHFPPIAVATTGKYPTVHAVQFVVAPSPATTGKKYTSVTSGNAYFIARG